VNFISARYGKKIGFDGEKRKKKLDSRSAINIICYADCTQAAPGFAATRIRR
jgi:hypothetical protein